MTNMRVGYVTGVFDLFHVGHLNILREAKKRVSYLVVGVSTDTLAESYKSKSPVIPLADRVEIVKSIKHVDQVVIQSSLDKMEAWHKIKYDILFVGSDWKGTPRWQKIEKTLQRNGIKVEFLPYTESTSSSMIIEEILQTRLSSN